MHFPDMASKSLRGSDCALVITGHPTAIEGGATSLRMCELYLLDLLRIITEESDPSSRFLLKVAACVSIEGRVFDLNIPTSDALACLDIKDNRLPELQEYVISSPNGVRSWIAEVQAALTAHENRSSAQYDDAFVSATLEIYHTTPAGVKSYLQSENIIVDIPRPGSSFMFGDASMSAFSLLLKSCKTPKANKVSTKFIDPSMGCLSASVFKSGFPTQYNIHCLACYDYPSASVQQLTDW